ncbi:MAG: lysophospholipid acyltransferase family protein [Planctomycetaceae bacterium]|jgi:1-acyl-sn-glycerol-3-phosphate acyltransferase|nr:lysophospholipid acyltransferase family protein [Phycisphaerales bacterium]MCE2653890.1 lysophospholipid acyltransferase family protein [Planctomycetaceae bacterium]
MATDPSILWPAAPSPVVKRFFGKWIARMLRSDFAAVRTHADTADHLRALERRTTPAVVLMNHASWWDPLLGMHLAANLCPSRELIAPMEMAMLRKFAFFRKLGVFGIEPDHPQAPQALNAYVLETFRTRPGSSFWLTPQGTFADVRTPIRLRPGAASVAASVHAAFGSVDVLCIAAELVFWTDRKPEALFRIAPCPCPRPDSTLAWLRAMTATMQSNADALAAAAVARDPAAFSPLLGGAAARVNPLYDLWLRLTGRSGALEVTRREGSPASAPVEARS